jgi:uncharacterized membrane protein YhiD involved in acid resistance
MDLTNPAPLSIPTLVFNFLIGLFLASVLAFYYARFGDSLSNRSKFAPILPLLAMITLLVISVVKSSLALSLGLVGALSIVRFRTAIKDPEELIYLFFAIAIGLGLGADQRIPTLVAFVIMILYLIGRKVIAKTFKLVPRNTLYMNIAMPLESTTDGQSFSFIQNLLTEELRSVDLRRFDSDGKEMRLVFYFHARNPDALARVADRIHQKFANASISFVEQNNLLGG